MVPKVVAVTIAAVTSREVVAVYGMSVSDFTQSFQRCHATKFYANNTQSSPRYYADRYRQAQDPTRSYASGFYTTEHPVGTYCVGNYAPIQTIMEASEGFL